ncbi:MAG TPA: hypothetical protein VF772_27255 [Terriglobales bacterium]
MKILRWYFTRVSPRMAAGTALLTDFSQILHTLPQTTSKPKPKLETRLIFFHRFGVLEREL